MHPKTGTFIIVRKTNGAFQFSLRADNGRAILISNEYSNRESCEKGIEAVRKYAQAQTNFQMVNFTEVDFYFKLEDEDGSILGSSDIYKSKLACKQDIIAVNALAAKAEVDHYAVDSITA